MAQTVQTAGMVAVVVAVEVEEGEMIFAIVMVVQEVEEEAGENEVH